MNHYLSDEAKVPGDFGFMVGEDIRMDGEARLIVCLPHSCDEWVIADEPTRAGAIGVLQLFIAEAMAALERLRASPDQAGDSSCTGSELGRGSIPHGRVSDFDGSSNLQNDGE